MKKLDLIALIISGLLFGYFILAPTVLSAVDNYNNPELSYQLTDDTVQIVKEKYSIFNEGDK